MMRPRGWTVDEVETLKSLYPTFGSFRELLDRLPGRSPNSIRLMASRLGLYRPSLLPNIERTNGFSVHAGDNASVKCSRCEQWFTISSNTTRGGEVVACPNCGGYSFITD